ncbi:terminase large subunit [Roseobacter sp. TSBP12]|uniref:terminase large subunit n=1 Tax=Roseobacter sp. TSBP12 TaxID=1236613 RepID=UPI00125FA596|nr:terminase large subunit [Roseobacter sp. TSBP12]KAB6714320.1 terminase large subunit [Roseobacter sp. TSBP12]
MSNSEALARFACPDWWEKLQAGLPPIADVPVNEAKAQKVVTFFNRLRLPDVAGAPYLADACGDWFRDILVAFLASEDPETFQPIVWELLCLVPKKNSKTTYGAGLGLTALYMEETQNRKMMLVGPSQAISGRCFDQARGMIDMDETLKKIFHVSDSDSEITRRKTNTSLAVKTFGTNIVTGEIPVLTIIDEVHELGKLPRAAAVMQQIRGGGITKQRGKLLMITTQSDESPAGVWRTELDKARKIRDGRAGPSPIMLPMLYEFPLELQRKQEFWRDQRNWPLVLPNLGLSIDPQALKDDYDNNGRVTKHAEQIWASQHLNIEIGVGLSAGWLGAQYWEDCVEVGLTLDELIERSDVAVQGIDGGGLDDLFAEAVIGRCRETGKWLHWARAFAHPEVFELREEIVPRLRKFAEDGDLIALSDDDTSGDVSRVAETAARLLAAGLLPEQGAIGVDTTNSAAIQFQMFGKGITYEQLVIVGQDWRLSPAIWGLERMLKQKTFLHGDQDLMSWTVGNAKPEIKGSAVRITKEVAGKAKIDPLMATLNAFMLMLRDPVAVNIGSYLDTKEMMVL